MEDSPVEIMEQEAIDTVEELWSRLFSMETQIDTDNFIQIEVGRGPRMTLTREPPPSPVRMDQQVILIPCHQDIVVGLVKSVLRLYLKLDTNTVNRCNVH